MGCSLPGLRNISRYLLAVPASVDFESQDGHTAEFSYIRLIAPEPLYRQCFTSVHGLLRSKLPLGSTQSSAPSELGFKPGAIGCYGDSAGMGLLDRRESVEALCSVCAP